MKQLRFYFLIILLWFLGFYNLERLIAPINLASFVYVLAAGYALFIILYAPIYRISVMWVFLAGLVPYFGLKLAFQSEIAGMNLPLTVTEVVSIAITIYLAWKIGHYMETLRTEVLQLTVGPSSVVARPFRSAQADFYREIRRARHYNRPAAVLSVTPSNETIDLTISRFLQEAQNNLVHQYIVARTADLLRRELKESDIVTMRNNHFLVLLPETEKKHLDTIIQRLQNSANKRLGLALNVGAATFPEEAITFESLVEYAEKRMKEAAPEKWLTGSPVASAAPVTEEKAAGPIVSAQPNAELQSNKELNKADLVG